MMHPVFQFPRTLIESVLKPSTVVSDVTTLFHEHVQLRQGVGEDLPIQGHVPHLLHALPHLAQDPQIVNLVHLHFPFQSAHGRPKFDRWMRDSELRKM